MKKVSFADPEAENAGAQVSCPVASRVLWAWVAVAFLVLALGWAAMFTVAHRVGIEDVPLATDRKGGR